MKVALCFAQFGPYHHARAAALRDALGKGNFLAVQIAAASRTYAWDASSGGKVEVITLCEGAEEDAGFLRVFRAALVLWQREKPDVALLPSYSPASSLALLLAAKVAGLKCVMMNESHAGTERARGAKRLLKKFLVSLFDGGLVGGQPQMRHFAKLGMRTDRMVTGYDAIDNAYFTAAAARARANAAAQRARLGLPDRYFLSLGRLVEKKNLGCLVDAYAALRHRLGPECPALVFVGSGDQEPILRDRCAKLGLKIRESRSSEVPKAPDHGPRTKDTRDGEAAVFFHGFRQIEENPIFYALAEAFILPSLYEEWGLVVNEAMACGLPVVASKTVGSAEDLVVDGVNGFQFDPASPDELADKLRLLAGSPELRASMGEASRKHIQDWGCQNFAAKALEICVKVTTDEIKT
jgi:glycosyltransferase involved in cell wall biosynthesis